MLLSLFQLNLQTAGAPGTLGLASIRPRSAAPNSAVTVVFTGTGFDGTNLTVNLSGTGVTAGSPSSVTPTQFSCVFTIAAGAALGPRNVTVSTTEGGTSSAKIFLVVQVYNTPNLSLFGVFGA